MVVVHKTCNSVLSRALALSAYRERRPFNCVFSCCIDLSGWTTSRPSNETLQPKCRRPADQSFCGKTGSWCGFVATENCYAFSDASTRQINLLHILCLCKGSFVLASQDARPRSSHLFPLLSGHFKQSNPCLLSPGRLTKHTKDLFSFQALCSPLLTESFWTRPWESQRNITADTQFCAEICDWLTLRGRIVWTKAGVQCGFV